MAEEIVQIYELDEVEIAQEFIADARKGVVQDYVIVWRRKCERKDHGDGLVSNNEVRWNWNSYRNGSFSVLGMLDYLKHRIRVFMDQEGTE